MTDCGEVFGSTHRCGECGDETYAVADLEKLHEEFSECDWPDKSLSAFLDWLKVRAGTKPPDELPVGATVLRPEEAKP